MENNRNDLKDKQDNEDGTTTAHSAIEFKKILERLASDHRVPAQYPSDPIQINGNATNKIQAPPPVQKSNETGNLNFYSIVNQLKGAASLPQINNITAPSAPPPPDKKRIDFQILFRGIFSLKWHISHILFIDIRQGNMPG
jgi:hypothetical protein